MGDYTVLTNDNFDQLINGSKPVLVDFWAVWCGPCKMFAPIIDQLAVQYKDKAIIGKLNTDDYENIAIKYKIMAIPTVMIFKAGKVVESFVGLKPAAEISKLLDKYL